jgi:hypothetical protein
VEWHPACFYGGQLETKRKVMKKLALLQLLLLPLAGLAEAPKSAETPAAVRCVEPSGFQRVLDDCEAGATSVAKRLVGLTYAQGVQRMR